MRTKDVKLAIAMVLVVLTAETVCRLWGRLPWREYAAVCELQYVYSADGVTRHAFDGDSPNTTQYELLLALREEWLSPTGLVARVRGQATSGDAVRCLRSATIEIRRRRPCIAVRTESTAPDTAESCAEWLARTIVSDYVERDTHRMNLALTQIRANYEKYLKHMRILEERKTQLRTLAAGGADSDETDREIESTRRILSGMRTTLEGLGNGKHWRSAIEKVGEHISIVPPNRPKIYSAVVGLYLALFLMTTCVVNLFYKLPRGRWSWKGTVRKQ